MASALSRAVDLDIPLVLLAGGRGTRIAGYYPELPKPMVPVAGRPFLEWVVSHFRGQGIRRFLFSTGWKSEVIEAHEWNSFGEDCDFICVREAAPLGTGGAVTHVCKSFLARHDASAVMIANADTLLVDDLRPGLQLMARPDVDGIVFGRRVADAQRYGTLVFDGDGMLQSFNEKQPGDGIINAGIYVLRSKVLSDLDRDGPFSLEQEGIPELLREGRRLAVAPCDGPFIDIGTPESLQRADAFVTQHFGGGTL